MKKVINASLGLLMMLVMLSNTATAQDSPKESENYKHNKEVYLKALKFSDVSIAREALYHLICLLYTSDAADD